MEQSTRSEKNVLKKELTAFVIGLSCEKYIIPKSRKSRRSALEKYTVNSGKKCPLAMLSWSRVENMDFETF